MIQRRRTAKPARNAPNLKKSGADDSYKGPTLIKFAWFVMMVILLIANIFQFLSDSYTQEAPADALWPSGNMANRKTPLERVSIPGENAHPNVMYGHVHMAKTGGTSLNGILANRFERICGHKGYSYDAYRSNERAKHDQNSISLESFNRDRVDPNVMNETGYENCDYVSHEVSWVFWVDTFGDEKFHDIPMELHIPCRDPIEHVMSQCNYRGWSLDCDVSDEELYDSINRKCFSYLKRRFNHRLENHFDVKCFDFKNEFTSYIEYMSGKLQTRRLVSAPYIKRETNKSRNKTKECIWERPDLLEKVNAYLLDKVPYYQFCDACMGSKNEIT
jgi:hypothetical protein